LILCGFNTLNNALKGGVLNPPANKRENVIVLIFDYKFMIDHKKNLKKILSTSEMENRIYRHVQKLPMSFLKQNSGSNSPEENLIYRYKLCYQVTGSLRVIFDWFINNMPIPAENIISMLNAMNIPNSKQFSSIPNILVRLKNQ